MNASNDDCPRCRRKSTGLLDGQRCPHCGALVCERCDQRIAEVDDLLAEDGQAVNQERTGDAGAKGG